MILGKNNERRHFGADLSPKITDIAISIGLEPLQPPKKNNNIKKIYPSSDTLSHEYKLYLRYTRIQPFPRFREGVIRSNIDNEIAVTVWRSIIVSLYTEFFPFEQS